MQHEPNMRVDIVSTLVLCIYADIIDEWLDKDIKCDAYKKLVKKLFYMYARTEFNITPKYEHRRLNNFLSSVFVKLNKKIRAKQKSTKEKRILEELDILNEIYTKKWEEDMAEFLQLVGHDLCPIEGYPTLNQLDD